MLVCLLLTYTWSAHGQERGSCNMQETGVKRMLAHLWLLFILQRLFIFTLCHLAQCLPTRHLCTANIVPKQMHPCHWSVLIVWLPLEN